MNCLSLKFMGNNILYYKINTQSPNKNIYAKEREAKGMLS